VKPIVYIDDEPLLCRVFTKIFESAGAPVVAFTDPEAAIAYLRDHEAAVIICDYRMPSLTGLDVLDRIPPGTPFFLVSGDLAITLARSDPRVTGILTKPFRAEALLERVRAYVPLSDVPDA
jgi:CheY-like chemotaxis protein